MKKFITYLAPSWEGEDGKPSYRRLSQLIFIVLIVFIVVKGQSITQWGFFSLLVLLVAFLLLAKMITMQQITKCLQAMQEWKMKHDAGTPPSETSPE